MRKRGFIIAILIFFAGCTGWYYTIPTASMLPTMKVGDTFTVNRFAYDASNPINRFDIVIFNAPEASLKRSGDKKGTVFCKRVVGLPGEKVEIKSGQVFINESPLNEPFQKIADKSNFQSIVIPQDEYFVLGDNRPNSVDSRFEECSTIKRNDILGKVTQIYSKQ